MYINIYNISLMSWYWACSSFGAFGALPALPRLPALPALPAFGVWPPLSTCFQAYSLPKSLSSACLLYCLSDLLPRLPWSSGLLFQLSSLLSFRLASRASVAFRASLLPVFFTVFPTCFQGAMAFRASLLPVFFPVFHTCFHGLQGLSTACLLSRL